jgi:hypothetical protein
MAWDIPYATGKPRQDSGQERTGAQYHALLARRVCESPRSPPTSTPVSVIEAVPA